MELLTSKKQKRVKKIFGTTLGMSDSDVEIVRRQIVQTLIEEQQEPRGKSDLNVDTRNQNLRSMNIALAKCKCADLFQEYRRSIGA